MCLATFAKNCVLKSSNAWNASEAHSSFVLPGRSPQATTLHSAVPTLASTETAPSKSSARLEIPGLRDIAVQRYSNWQCSQVGDKTLKMQYRKACDLTLADGLDLEDVYEDQDAGCYVDKGVKRSVARRFVSDIGTWAKQYKGV